MYKSQPKTIKQTIINYARSITTKHGTEFQIYDDVMQTMNVSHKNYAI